MTTEQEQPPEQHGHPSRPVQQQQQEQPSEGHGGQGSESALKQLRVWEQRRSSQSGGKRRHGPDN